MNRVVKPAGLKTKFNTLHILWLIGPRVTGSTGSPVVTARSESLCVASIKDAVIHVVSQAYLRRKLTPRLTAIEYIVLTCHGIHKIIIDHPIRPTWANARGTMSE